MSSEKKPNTAANIFANALASTPKYVDAGVSAGMHNTLTCANCGAARENSAGASDVPVCRYCNAPLSAKPK
ncbi:MAG: hypothetical protein BGO98_38675 [Myxococcales bacterium 68-20]|nr:hypothetical protein [Myxococcales bacterium]OJY26294.1 MAG: hypothetical protein BGO98_38675 [Myxococcales bacterium 68-20]